MRADRVLAGPLAGCQQGADKAVAPDVKAEADEVSSTREAKQLAYCLFWNVRPPDTERCAATLTCACTWCMLSSTRNMLWHQEASS